MMNKPAASIQTKVSISALTDAGRVRTHNEDNFIVCTDLTNNKWVLTEGWTELSKNGCLLVLADGMGGANAGEVASSIAVEAIKEHFSELSLQMVEPEDARKNFLLAAVSKAHDGILAKAKSDQSLEGMGTTIVIAWTIQNKLYVCWCGDSRAYKYNAVKGLRLLTKDHSLVWELVEAGKLTPDEADVHPDNNIITKSLGDPARSPKADIVVDDLESRDKILLCSDGLNNMVDAKTIENALRNESPLTQITSGLIQLANAQGGKDNVTVILLQMLISESDSRKLPGNKKRGLSLIIPLTLALVILSSISFIWENKNRNAPGASGNVILPHDADSIAREPADNNPSGLVTRKTVIDSSSGNTKKPLHLRSLAEEKVSDSLESISARIKDLQTLMSRWNRVKKTFDSLQVHAKKMDGAEMLLLIRQIAEFESFIAKGQFQRLFDEWSGFQNNPNSKVLSERFVVDTLDRKIAKGNKLLFKLDGSLKNMELNQ